MKSILIVLCVVFGHATIMKGSVSFSQIQSMITELSPAIEKKLNSFHLDNVETISGHAAGGTYTAKITNLRANNIDINLPNIQFTAQSNNELSIVIPNMTIDMTTHIWAQYCTKILWVKVCPVTSSGDVQLVLSNFNIQIVADFSYSETGTGVNINIKSINPNIGSSNIIAHNSGIIFKTIVKLAKKFITEKLPGIISGLTSKVNPVLQKLTQKNIAFNTTIHNNLYVINGKLSECLKFQNNYIELPLTASVKNQNTSQSYTPLELSTLNDRVSTDQSKYELGLGNGLINMLLWTLSDSELVHFKIDQSFLNQHKLNVTLDTNLLKSVSDVFINVYGQQPVYLVVGLNKQPELFIRSGNMMVELPLNVEIHTIVNSTDILSHSVDITAFANANVHVDQQTVQANLISLQIIDLQRVAGEIFLEDSLMKDNLDGVMELLVPVVNKVLKPFQLKDIPKVSNLEVNILETSLYVALNLDIKIPV